VLVTEAEARKKWCPMVRIARRESPEPYSNSLVQIVVAGCNTDALGGTRVPASCRCIASDCMMWVTAGEAPVYRTLVCAEDAAETEPARPDHVPPSWTFVPASEDDNGIAHWIEPDNDYNARRLGRCGLARAE